MNPAEVVQSCTGETSIQPLVNVTCSQWRTRRSAGKHCMVLDVVLRAKVTSIPIRSMCSWRSICLNWALNTPPGMRQALCRILFTVRVFYFQNAQPPKTHFFRNFFVKGWKIIPSSSGSQEGCSLESQGAQPRWCSVNHGVLRFRSRPCLSRASGGPGGFT